MIAHTNSLLEEHRECFDILLAYQKSESSFVNQSETIWSKRLSDVSTKAGDEEEEAIDQSSQAHGLLIAYGFLDIELAGRDAGIQYRITSDGKKALARSLKKENNHDES